MAHGTVRQNFETALYIEAESADAVLSLIDDVSFKASEGQLDYPPAEGNTNYVVHVTIEPMV